MTPQLSEKSLHKAPAPHAEPELTGYALWRLCGIPHKRHTAAMRLLDAGIDVAMIAIWLGHAGIESSQPYLHANMKMKEDALARTTPTKVATGRYQATDELLNFLKGL